ncbi:transglutaminase-like cysteine peptidase [Alkalimonas delamerensis]|uniref:Transglutaminase-like cysteine peptidase n=1 Tax=Alkalimonas delamerensis TaxID=265981 RepID=A0ABT9GRT4_9GAMM|nr:transglutaminase-like cysteine peptidase [Alkalimonas delamerensis]MDP4529687.1 transglutaminase-like cysteine peptidase [Alkalimonas delamerensis]
MRLRLLLLLLLATGCLLWADPQQQQALSYLRANFDEQAVRRYHAWRQLIDQQQETSAMEQLEAVNRFFNLFQFMDDSVLWGQEDYWATPLEFIGMGAGDCEDFSIAKYFTLLEMGFDSQKLRLVYVKAVQLNQFHMVLAYYETPSAVPLILDNLDGAIRPATQRPDLVPVFSFNGQQLWLNRQRGRAEAIGSPERLPQWVELLERYAHPR